MKISPEPLHPMRQWRELWQAQPPISAPALPDRVAFKGGKSNQQKQPAFRWLNNLLNRD